MQFLRCGGFPTQIPGYKCTPADISMFDVHDAVYPATVPVVRGVISRPLGRTFYSLTAADSLPDPAQKFEISPNNDLVVTGKVGYNNVGDRLDKIGWPTGWMSGLVTQTCVDEVVVFPTENVVNYCVDVARIPSEPGDSGAPIFKYLSGQSVLFAGIAVAYSYNSSQGFAGWRMVFVTMPMLESVFGTLTVTP